MSVEKGVRLGPYEIVSHIGSGGMGEVWRARDSRIGRDVAIKVLGETFGAGDDRVARFEQESRAAGALHHPGLVTIFDVGTTAGTPYIVMELLEGQTLRQVMDQAAAPLPPRRAIEIAMQIASALAVAHAHGIIHRDLKPENIFITNDRLVKILDFGLAKLAPEVADPKHDTARHLTSAGLVVGTPGYMSPEQVRAAAIDHRTDIFSLGSVLYEMLAGRAAFVNDSAIEIMHAVLNEEPPPLGHELSHALDSAVRHCMEKDPRERFQSARDLAFHLRSLPEVQRNATARLQAIETRKRRPLRAGIIALAVLLAVIAGGFVWRGWRGGAVPVGARSFAQLTSADGLESLPTLAPDGKSFAYVSAQAGNRDIYVQRVDGRMAINLTADSLADDSEPAFSPDGSKIAFRSEREGGGIFVMSASGESAIRLTDFGHNPSWSPDGNQIAFATELVELLPNFRPRFSEMWAVDVRTGARRPLVQAHKGGPDFGSSSDAVQPSWSPHGNRIAFWSVSVTGQRDIMTIDPSAPEPKRTAVRVTTDSALHWNPVWSPDGKYLYYGSDRDGTLNLWRVAMDESSGAPAGPPEFVGLPAASCGNFAFAKSGDMVYVMVTSSYRVLAMPFDANAGTVGAPRPLFGGSQEILTYEPSPDGKSIAYATSGVREDLYVADGTHIRQLTNDPARDRGVQWSSDGKTLYFYSNRDGKAYRIWSIHADGSHLTAITTDADAKALGESYLHSPLPSPDGQTLIVQTNRQSGLLHLDRSANRIELLPVQLPSPRWSPDGQFIVSRAQREPEGARAPGGDDPPSPILLYSLRTRRCEKLADGGWFPQWTGDGKKIVWFARQEIRIFDVASHSLRIVPFTAQIDLRNNPRLLRSGTTLYVRQALQQGDIWMAQLPNG